MSFAKIGGVSLHYRFTPSSADAEPIVFINSLGTDFRIWDTVAADLADEAPTLVYDKRGHGLSDLGDGIRSIDDHVDDLLWLLERLVIGRAIICGLSVGGLIAQRLYQRRPELVASLILCDTAHRIGTAEMWNTRIATVEAQGMAAIADGVMEKWFTPHFHANRAAELAGYRNMLIRQPVAGYAGTCAAIRDADYTDATADIAVRTLCVVGDQDGSTPPDLVRSLANLIPGSRFDIIRDAGHIPCVEQPDALAALIRGFVASGA
ncbi:3-oxoadipate enol-lactonase [Mesorhizobium sp. IMUNJ 23232]|uniref:3-oxoadipate enol-lactonase n=1 Tax=Mesorhizobium sp. IMUNJ 23232 TaxID=3376064 RepID=UPI0037BDF391